MYHVHVFFLCCLIFVSLLSVITQFKTSKKKEVECSRLVLWEDLILLSYHLNLFICAIKAGFFKVSVSLKGKSSEVQGQTLLMSKRLVLSALWVTQPYS